MTTAVLQKKIKTLEQRQIRLEQMVANAFRARGLDLSYGDWELKPSAIKRIARARKHIAAGKGVTFGSVEEIRRYFRTKRYAR